MTDLPILKLQALVTFPAQILDGAGIDVFKVNGAYRFDIAYDDFAPPVAGIIDPSHQQVLLWNSVTGIYQLAPVSIVGAGGAVPEAPTDGQQYGRVGSTASWTPITGGTPSSTVPLVESGAGAVGVSGAYARADHVHPASPFVSDPLKQNADADLTAIAALGGTGIARRTGANTWTVGDPVANADLATMAAFTLKANNTSGAAVPTDMSIPSLVQKTTPAGGDFLMLSDTSAAGVLKRVAWSDLPGATGGIPEAPNDANTYGRHALGWTAIANVVTPSPLSSSNDTNVTLTLGGTPTTALLQNVSITAGWTGRLAYTRFTQGGALSVLGVSGNATADHASIASGGDGQVLRQSGLTLSFGTLTTLSYADASVTYAKIQNVSATARLLGRVSAGAGPVEELTAAQGITVLGLGTAATKNVGGSGASVVPTFDVPGTWTGTQGYPESALTYVSTGATLWPTDTSQVATLSMAAATGNTTMAQPSSVTAGRVYTIRIQQHATTPRAISWNLGSYLWIGGPAAPVISTGGNAVDRFTFIGRTGNVLEEIGRAQDIK